MPQPLPGSGTKPRRLPSCSAVPVSSALVSLTKGASRRSRARPSRPAPERRSPPRRRASWAASAGSSGFRIPAWALTTSPSAQKVIPSPYAGQRALTATRPRAAGHRRTCGTLAPSRLATWLAHDGDEMCGGLRGHRAVGALARRPTRRHGQRTAGAAPTLASKRPRSLHPPEREGRSLPLEVHGAEWLVVKHLSSGLPGRLPDHDPAHWGNSP